MTRRAAIGALSAAATASAQTAPFEKDIVYVRYGAIEPKLDVYLPETRSGKLPVVMWIHGGGWRQGSKDKTPAARLTRRGYAVVSVQYRLSGVAKFPAQIHDCKAAVRWVRANAGRYGFDADRIAAWGASAGGHLVALLGTSGDAKELEGEGHPGFSSRVQAVVDFFGPTDFLRMNSGFRDGVEGKIDHDAADSPESLLVGGPIGQHRDKVAAANPITYVSRSAPPFLIMHGDRDPLVPLEQSELLRDALQKAGVPVTMQVVKGAGHGFSGPNIDAAVDEFLDRVLKS
jgi:acetyl esterase/lipase